VEEKEGSKQGRKEGSASTRRLLEDSREHRRLGKTAERTETEREAAENKYLHCYFRSNAGVNPCIKQNPELKREVKLGYFGSSCPTAFKC
jgi:hypothetical protein